MALYLGSDKKFKITIDGKQYSLKFFSTTPITNGVRLLTSEDEILKDSNGLYITAKEGD